MWLFPWLTLATIAGMAAVLMFMGINPARRIELWTSLLVAALFLAGFAVMKKARG